MNVYVRELFSNLARQGHDCHVFTRSRFGHPGRSLQVEPGVMVHELSLGELEELEKESLLEYVPVFAERVLARVRALGLRPSLIQANYWLSGMVGHYLKHELGVPLFTTFHTLEKAKLLDRDAPDDGFDSSTRVHHEQRVLGCSDTVLVSGQPERDWLTRLYGFDSSRISEVRPGVIPAIFSPGSKEMARSALGLPVDARLVLMVGRIQALKGFPMGVEAISLLPEFDNYHIVIVGGPSGQEGCTELSALDELAQIPSLRGRVHIYPAQPHELLSTFYRSADVVLVPSRTESFGLVALEAQACGRPVVATAIGGLTSIIEDGMTGILVAERSPHAFAKAVSSIFETPGYMDSLSSNAASKGSTSTWMESARSLVEAVDGIGDLHVEACG